jgi:DNA-binding NarL/FixJ family response regulator
MPKKILITDDHPAMRNGVKMVVSSVLSDVEFGEARNAAEAERLLREKDWDVLILDMDMPGRSGLDVLQLMHNEAIKVPTLVFSLHAEEQIAVRVMKLGAWGYLSKDSADQELGEAIRSLLSGRKYITSSLAGLLATYLSNPENKPPHELLSDKEYQTLLMIGKGKTISLIAEELCLSPSTISTFRARILEKMNMKNNGELIKYVVDNKLI